MEAKIKSALFGLSIDSFIQKVRYILSVLVSTSNFPNLPYPVPEIEADTNTLATLQGQVVAGNRINIGSRNEMKKTIRKKMAANAGYINSIATGNPAMLETSGYDMAKMPVPHGVPAAVAKVVCKVVQPSGSVKVSWSASKERDFYVLEKRIGEQGTWEEVFTTTDIKHIVSGLPVKQEVFFRVAAVNRAGMSPWCDPTSIMVA